MPACDHCGKVAQKVTVNANGRTTLKLCPMCQAEFDLKQSSELKPSDLTSSPPTPWWKRLWTRIVGGPRGGA